MSATVPAPWALPDGRAATLRAIAPENCAMESAFLATLSLESSYNRLFSTRHASDNEIRRWTNVDPAREAALVVKSVDATGGETMLAVDRLVHDDDGPGAEFVLLVGDASRRPGLGRRLPAALLAEARARRVRELHGSTLSTNVAMLGLGRALGFGAPRIGDAVVTRLSLRL